MSTANGYEFMKSKLDRNKIRFTSAYALCLKDGFDPFEVVDGQARWQTYLSRPVSW